MITDQQRMVILALAKREIAWVLGIDYKPGAIQSRCTLTSSTFWRSSWSARRSELGLSFSS